MKDLEKLEKRDLTREKILDAEAVIAEMPQIEIPVTHHFAKDTYGREITIPAGAVVVGKIHKFSSLNILASGSMLLATEDGVKKIEAPRTVVSQPGTKRLAFAIEDCTWITVHGTDETDVELIEKEFIAESFDDVAEIETECKNFLDRIEKESLCLG